MHIRSRAPSRIDLAGGWTDVPPFADREGGATVNIAISRYTFADLLQRSDSALHLASADYAMAVDAPSRAGLVYDGRLDLLKAAIRRTATVGGLDLTTRSELPPGSGLGTSAALAVAVLGALDQLAGKDIDPAAIAALANLLEVEELLIAGGKQDQLAAAWGGINLFTFGPDKPVRRQLQLRQDVVAALERRCVLCYSGVSRLSGDIIQRVQHAYTTGELKTCAALRTMAGLAEAAASALLSGSLDDLGAILADNWRCQRDLHPTVTNGDLESLFEIAAQHGALGGKACGAGGGGCVVFIAANEAEQPLRDALEASGAQVIPFMVDQLGLQVAVDATADDGPPQDWHSG